MLLSEAVTEEEIAQQLRIYGVRASITYDEDKVLSGLRLKDRMPRGFFIEGDPLYRNPLARYIAAGIELTARHPANDWFLHDHPLP